MKISLSSVTASRHFDRAFGRVSTPLDALRTCAEDISTGVQSLDTVQVVFVDQPETYVEVQRTPKGSRILQVLVGLPTGLSLKPEDDAVLLATIGAQVLRALGKSGLPEEQLAAVTRRVAAWKSSIYKLLDQEPIH